MKSVIWASKGTYTVGKVKKMFSIGDFLLLLKQIKELEGLEISLSKVPYEGIQLTIGDNVYSIEDIFPGHDLYE